MKNKKILKIGGFVLGGVLILSGVIFGTIQLKKYQDVKETNKSLSYLFANELITPEDDVYSKQKEMDNKIKEVLKSKKYTIEDPLVLENPYYINPLSAMIVFRTSKKSTVTLEVNGKQFEFEEAKEHAIPVYGLVAGKKNIVKITCDGNTKELTLDMEEVELKDIKVETSNKEKIDDDIYLVGTPLESGVYGFNKDGELVFLLTENYGQAIVKLANGHLLLSNSNYINDSRTGLLEIDYLGKIYKVYDIAGGYHDDAIKLDNGHIILGSSKLERDTSNDYIVEIDPDTGKVVDEWDLRKIVDDVSLDFVEKIDYYGWANNNSIYYDKKSNSLILSLEGRNSIVSIDYSSKKINWIFGDIKYWNDDFKSYMLELDDGNYPLLSNTVSINSDGNLVLFNNNMDGSLKHDALCREYIGAHSSGQIYKIENKKITKIQEFTDNNSFYSYAVSNYNELDNGNYILFSAWQFGDNTMNVDGCTMNTNVDGLNATLYELDKNNNILFKANMSGGAYRATKLSLYEKQNKNFQVEDVKYYNTNNDNLYDTVTTDSILNSLKNATDFDFSVNLTKNLLNINASFQNEDEVYALLVGQDGYTYKYLVKQKNGFLQPIVNLQNLKGNYALFLVINDDYYNLNKAYTF